MSNRGGGDDNHSVITSTSGRRSSIACSALVLVGVPPGMADFAVELCHMGVQSAKLRTVRLKQKVRDRLTRLLFTHERPPHQDMTIVITGSCDDNTYSADILLEAHPEGDTVLVHKLHHISRLVVGNMGITVKDLGNYTQERSAPYSLIMALDTLICLIRKNWRYEKFSRYRHGLASYTIIKISAMHSSKSLLWVMWDDKGSLSCSRAAIWHKREWKETGYSKKSKMRNVTDVEVMEENNGRMLAFNF